MSKLNNQRYGFSAIGIVAVILVLTSIGLVGWSIVNRTNKTSNSIAQTATDKTKSTTSSSTTTQTTRPTYLVISQWGIKLPLSSSISDAYYVPSNSGVATDGQPNMFASLKSLDSTGCNASNSNSGQNGAIGLLGHSPASQTDPVSGELVTKQYPNGTLIGNTYYYFQDRSQGLTCTSQSNLASISTAFATAAKNITTN